MNDLTTWLRAQLDEDERIAGVLHARTCGHENVTRSAACDCDWHVARVLADVAAKRAILDLIDSAHGGCLAEGCMPVDADDIVRHLAAPYVDRPGYLSDWRPQ